MTLPAPTARSSLDPFDACVIGAGAYATPTYTIVQLALRLGDHLGGVLKG